jgi:hypothetical protein
MLLRKIPGMEEIASCLFSPSITKTGITKSFTERLFSCTKLLIDAPVRNLLFLLYIIIWNAF